MKTRSFIGTLALTSLLAGWAAGVQASGGHGSVQQTCSARTSHAYGFQCHGWAQLAPGLGLEAVTFVGVVSGSRSGRFDGTGTFNSGFGGARQRVTGPAIFSDRSCAGSIKYDVFLQLPGGGEVPLEPLYIDFVTVGGGDEVLGVPTAPAGVTGAAVPRMVCRLVKVRD